MINTISGNRQQIVETLNVVVVHLFLNHYNFRMRKWIDPDNFALNQSIEWLSQNK